MILIIIGIGVFLIVMNNMYGTGENWLSFLGGIEWLDSEGMDIIVIVFVICAIFIIKYFGGGKNG